MNRTNSLLVIFACVVGLFRTTCIGAEVVTLTAEQVDGFRFSPTTITLAAGDLATVESIVQDDAELVEITYPNRAFDNAVSRESAWIYNVGQPWVARTIKIAGPASIRFGYPPFYSGGRNFIWATFSITRATALENAIPANAVVIPEDAGGQFQVILESSTDLLNWQVANPGNYGGSTHRRFFRTRIVRVN
jgi:hypothetical protein